MQARCTTLHQSDFHKYIIDQLRPSRPKINKYSIDKELTFRLSIIIYACVTILRFQPANFMHGVNPGGVQRGQILRKLPQISVGNLQKLRKPAEAYGNPTEDLVEKPYGNPTEDYGNPAEAYGNPAEAYGKPAEDLVAHFFYMGNFFYKTTTKRCLLFKAKPYQKKLPKS